MARFHSLRGIHPESETERFAFLDNIMKGDEDRLDRHQSKAKQAMPSVLAGFARPVIANIAIIVKQSLMWWFRVPVKLFRPYAVNPWMMLHELAESESKEFNSRYITEIVKRDGFKVVIRNVWPPMLANGIAGASLFHSYTVCNIWLRSRNFDGPSAYFLAGGISGVVHSCVATPMDHLTKRAFQENSIRFWYHGYHQVVKNTLNLIPGSNIKKVKILYQDLVFNSMRDIAGFALFFGVYENLQSIGRNHLSADRHDIGSFGKALVTGGTLLMSGAAAGSAYQLVAFPLNQLKGVFSSVQKDSCRNLSKLEVAKIIRATTPISAIFSGISTQIRISVPPSALGLLIYELSKDWIMKL